MVDVEGLTAEDDFFRVIPRYELLCTKYIHTHSTPG